MGDIARACVVTGGTGHLGRLIVERLIDGDGLTVLSASRGGVYLSTPVSRVQVGAGVDLTTANGARALAAVIDEVLPGPFSVVNCVGSFPGYRQFADVAHEEAEDVVRRNFLSVYFVALSLLPLMTIPERGGGDFVSFSSLSVSGAYPLMAAFDSSKAAVEQLTKHLANEYGGRGIRANVFALATLKTADEIRLKPHGDHQHWVEPTEVAAMVSELLAQTCRLANGNVLKCYHYSDRFYSTSYYDRVKK